MVCPKCNGKVRVTENSHNTVENEDYRRRKCEVCGHIFYTVEYEVEYTEDFKKEFNHYIYLDELRKKEKK